MRICICIQNSFVLLNCFLFFHVQFTQICSIKSHISCVAFQSPFFSFQLYEKSLPMHFSTEISDNTLSLVGLFSQQPNWEIGSALAELQSYCSQRCMKLNSSNGHCVAQRAIDSIAIDGFSATMHNIDEKGRKDVLVTTAVSEKLMLKGLHTYLETLDERYVKVKVRIEFTNYLGLMKVY